MSMRLLAKLNTGLRNKASKVGEVATFLFYFLIFIWNNWFSLKKFFEGYY